MKKPTLLPAVAVVGGLIGLAVRCLYLARGFDAETGLPVHGALTLWAMLLVVVLVGLAALVCARGKHHTFSRGYTEAFSPESLFCHSGMLAGGVLLLMGGGLSLSGWMNSSVSYLTGQKTMGACWGLLGLFCLLSALGTFLTTIKLKKNKAVTSAWVTLPGFSCCLWVMANYQQSWASEAVLGQYLVPMFAGIFSMLSCCFVAGFAFEKGRVALTQFLCIMAAALNLMSLADGLSMANTAIALAMTFYLLSMTSALADNDAWLQQSACGHSCAGCPGCTPLVGMENTGE